MDRFLGTFEDRAKDIHQDSHYDQNHCAIENPIFLFVEFLLDIQYRHLCQMSLDYETVRRKGLFQVDGQSRARGPGKTQESGVRRTPDIE